MRGDMPVVMLLLYLLGLVSADPVVQVQQGALRGKLVENIRGGLPYSVFHGIPYAEPPTGPLRFKNPQPPKPWAGVRNSSREAPVCVQCVDGATPSGQEDCLYLNVFTPKTAFSSVDSSLPVMVFIHGGAFMFGSGNHEFFGPDYFILEGVVMVSFNYRLGAFGFLSFLNEEFPGNMGLKDQTMALRWVQDNIAVFGGDATRVTIFGGSAGAASVHAHVLSQQSAGLFHKAISQSGTMMSPWATSLEPLHRARKLAEAVRCEQSNLTAIGRCLQNASMGDIATASTTRLITPEDFLNLNILPFAPVIDANIVGIDPFFPADPESLMKSGQFQKVPYIAGVNSAELLLLLVEFKQRGYFHLLFLPDSEKDGLLDNLLERDHLPRVPHLDSLSQLNPGNTSLVLKALSALVQTLSNLMFRFPTVRTMELQSQHSSAQFLYEFDFEGALGYLKHTIPEPLRQIPGVPHAEECFYMFDLKNTSLPDTDPAMKTLFRVVRMWSNMAKHSDPTPEPDPFLNVRWKTYNNEDKPYLAIANDLITRCDLTVRGEPCGDVSIIRNCLWYIIILVVVLTMCRLTFKCVYPRKHTHHVYRAF